MPSEWPLFRENLMQIRFHFPFFPNIFKTRSQVSQILDMLTEQCVILNSALHDITTVMGDTTHDAKHMED